MTNPERFAVLASLLLFGLYVPSVSASGQAAGISRPHVVPDREWIATECSEILDPAQDVDSDPTPSVQLALERAATACRAYDESDGGPEARDSWVRAMLAIQDDVGAMAMRRFVPEFGDALPEGMESYSLFLIPDPRWQEDDLEFERTQLWEAFYDFGYSIGDDHAAIWFLDESDNVDVRRSQAYCRLFGLSYNDGPYVVVVSERPDMLEPEDDAVVIRMGGVAPDRVVTILNRLAFDLQTGEVRTGGLVFEEIRQRIFTLVSTYPEDIRAFASFVFGF